MALYKITKAEEDEIENDHAEGRKLQNKTRMQKAKMAAENVDKIRAILGQRSTFVSRPCPIHDDEHKAVKCGQELFCPITIMLWKFRIAFEDEKVAEWLQQFEKGDGINAFIRPYKERRNKDGG